MDIQKKYEDTALAALQLAEHLVSLDETEKALMVLNDCIPALIRHHVPEPIKKLKTEILSQIFTPEDYANNPKDHLSESPFEPQHVMEQVMRGHVVKKLVEDYNKGGKAPHIVDFGPGTYWLPLALEHHGLKHSYKGVGVEATSEKQFFEKTKNTYTKQEGDPEVFVAYEIIEHVDEHVLAQAKARHCPNADYILVSTPRFTFGTGTPDWRKEKIHHLRAYTPNEFLRALQRLFPECKNWQYVDDVVMVAIGET